MRFLLALLLFLGGCSNAVHEKLAFHPISDLHSAAVSAEAAGDKLALACYKVLIAYQERVGASNLLTNQGPVTAYQQTRNTRRFLLSDELNSGCGPLLADEISPIRSLLR